jgi:hypothetical protein
MRPYLKNKLLKSELDITAQVLEQQPSKYKALSSNPSTAEKNKLIKNRGRE